MSLPAFTVYGGMHFGVVSVTVELNPTILEQILSNTEEVKANMDAQLQLLQQSNAVLATMSTTFTAMDTQLGKVFTEVTNIKDKLDQAGDSVPSDIVQAVATHGETINTLRETLGIAAGQLSNVLGKLTAVDNVVPDEPEVPPPPPPEGEDDPMEGDPQQP